MTAEARASGLGVRHLGQRQVGRGGSLTLTSLAVSVGTGYRADETYNPTLSICPFAQMAAFSATPSSRQSSSPPVPAPTPPRSRSGASCRPLLARYSGELLRRRSVTGARVSKRNRPANSAPTIRI